MKKTYKTIIIIDAFDYDGLGKVNAQQVNQFFSKLAELGVKLRKTKVINVIHTKDVKSGLGAQNVKGGTLLDKESFIASMDDISICHKDDDVKEKFTFKDCGIIAESLIYTKNAIIISDGLAGIIGEKLSILYDIEYSESCIGEYYKDEKLLKNSMVVIKLKKNDYSTSQIISY